VQPQAKRQRVCLLLRVEGTRWLLALRPLQETSQGGGFASNNPIRDDPDSGHDDQAYRDSPKAKHSGQKHHDGPASAVCDHAGHFWTH
jgi:hypothetical protein